MVSADPKDDRESEREIAVETSAVSGRARALAGLIVRVGVLGLNAWVVIVALPASLGPALIFADAVLVGLPLVALAIGLRMLWQRRDEALGLLIVGVPVLLATAVAGRSDPALVDRYGTATTILGALSMLAYVIAAAHAIGRPAVLRATEESKLARSVRARADGRGLRALVLGTTCTMAFLIAIVVPAMGSRAGAVEAWGDAADEGRTLAAIVGGAIACVAAAVIIGPSLRAARPTSRPSEGTLTLALALLVAATGAIAWGILGSLTH